MPTSWRPSEDNPRPGQGEKETKAKTLGVEIPFAIPQPPDQVVE
jgi:hypothetical protein